MQPQNTPPTTPNYDFILHDNKPVKRGFNLPFPKLPKPLGMILALVLGLFVVIVIYGLLSGGSTKSTGLAGIASEAQEISRVSGLVVQATTDPSLKSLAATTQTSMSSDVAQIQDYLVKNGSKKLNAAALAAKKNSTTDTSVTTENQNNTLATFYKAYLKDKLTTYQADLQATYSSSGAKAKVLLAASYQSSKTLLGSLN